MKITKEETEDATMDFPLQSGNVLDEPGAVMFDPSNVDEPIVISPTNSNANCDQENERPRNVRFDVLPEKPKTIQEKLDQAKADFTAERSLRKRKEKVLVKLAKELTKRSEECKTLQSKIFQMASTINSLQETVQNQHHEMEESQIQYRKLTREADVRVSNFETTTTNLRKELLELKLQNDSLKLRLAGNTGIQNTFVVIWMTTMICSMWRFSKDVAKSPVRPFTTLVPNSGEGVYYALWWVPKFLKNVQLFHSTSKLTWEKEQLTIQHRNETVFEGKAKAVEISLRTITITQETSTVIPAPWAIKQS